MFLNVTDKISSCYLISVIILSVEKRIMNLCDARELSSYHLPKQNTRHNLMVQNSIYVFERCYYISIMNVFVCVYLFIIATGFPYGASRRMSVLLEFWRIVHDTEDAPVPEAR